ncbi:hypothetical protein BC830DRAFT_1102530 [Chytriomyces sp. MP71]|nr:hypothetical protein BC830DRAFT_1102530 [Chytriomyces sp. MP71]
MSQYPGSDKAQFAQPSGPPPAMYAQPGYAQPGGQPMYAQPGQPVYNATAPGGGYPGQPVYATQPGHYPPGQGTPQVVYVQQPPQQQNNAMGSSGGFCFGLLACCAVEELLCCLC